MLILLVVGPPHFENWGCYVAWPAKFNKYYNGKCILLTISFGPVYSKLPSTYPLEIPFNLKQKCLNRNESKHILASGSSELIKNLSNILTCK